jgi:predicted nucleotidyltransferase
MINAPLKDNEREMLEKLMAGIRERFGDLLIEARLFGSKARGDSDPESDIDVWLLFERDLAMAERRELTRLAVDLELAHDVVVQTIVDARWRWDMLAYRRSGFALAVEAEGVTLCQPVANWR